MGTTAQNNLIRQVNPKSLIAAAKAALAANAGCTFNQGDILCYDANAKYLRPVTGSGDSTIVVGAALQTVSSGVMPSPIQGTAVDGAAAIEDMAGPMYGSTFRFALASGQNYPTLCKLYLTTTDAQTLSSAATGSYVGIYQGPALTSAPTGTFGEVLLGATYNMSDTQF